MITWIKKKHYENKVNLAFYKSIYKILENQEDMITIGTNLYIALKNVPANELKNELITKIAEQVHHDKNVRKGVHNH